MAPWSPGQEDRRGLVDSVGSSSETGDVEVTLAPGEGKRKLINSCAAQLNVPMRTPEKGLCIGSYWPEPPPRLQGWVRVESSWFVWGLGCALHSQERRESGCSAGEGSEHQGARQSRPGNLCGREKGMKH